MIAKSIAAYLFAIGGVLSAAYQFVPLALALHQGFVGMAFWYFLAVACGLACAVVAWDWIIRPSRRGGFHD